MTRYEWNDPCYFLPVLGFRHKSIGRRKWMTEDRTM